MKKTPELQREQLKEVPDGNVEDGSLSILNWEGKLQWIHYDEQIDPYFQKRRRGVRGPMAKMGGRLTRYNSNSR